MSERIKFTVWRDKWLQGLGGWNSCLLTTLGDRCCLGHLARDVGYSDAEIDHVAAPSGVNDPSRWPSRLVEAGMTSMFASRLMSVNDSMDTTRSQKEETLTRMFSEVGIDVEFKDGTGP